MYIHDLKVPIKSWKSARISISGKTIFSKLGSYFILSHTDNKCLHSNDRCGTAVEREANPNLFVKIKFPKSDLENFLERFLIVTVTALIQKPLLVFEFVRNVNLIHFN